MFQGYVGKFLDLLQFILAPLYLVLAKRPGALSSPGRSLCHQARLSLQIETHAMLKGRTFNWNPAGILFWEI